jgi:hypothetical protein
VALVVEVVIRVVVQLQEDQETLPQYLQLKEMMVALVDN